MLDCIDEIPFCLKELEWVLLTAVEPCLIHWIKRTERIWWHIECSKEEGSGWWWEEEEAIICEFSSFMWSSIETGIGGESWRSAGRRLGHLTSPLEQVLHTVQLWGGQLKLSCYWLCNRGVEGGLRLNLSGFLLQCITDPHPQVQFLSEESYKTATVELMNVIHSYLSVPSRFSLSCFTVQKATFWVVSPFLTFGRLVYFFFFEWWVPTCFFQGLIDTVLFK